MYRNRATCNAVQFTVVSVAPCFCSLLTSHSPHSPHPTPRHHTIPHKLRSMAINPKHSLHHWLGQAMHSQLASSLRGNLISTANIYIPVLVLSIFVDLVFWSRPDAGYWVGSLCVSHARWDRLLAQALARAPLSLNGVLLRLPPAKSLRQRLRGHATMETCNSKSRPFVCVEWNLLKRPQTDPACLLWIHW